MKEFLHRVIVRIFLLLPISCCLLKIYDYQWTYFALIMSFGIGLGFVSFKGE